MLLHKLVIPWQGAQIKGAAVTVLHFDATTSTAPPVAAVKSAFQAANAVIPGGITLSFPTSGDIIDSGTGHLTGSWNDPTGGTVQGNGTANCAAGVGACCSWNTNTLATGKKGPRRLRGRTFIVPFASNEYDVDGTLNAASFGVVDQFGLAMVSTGSLAIWHRPTTKGGTDGSAGVVTAHRVSDKVAILTSRRD